MKIKILKETSVKGQHCTIGSVVEASQTDAEYLVGMGKAEMDKIADWIDQVIVSKGDSSTQKRISEAISIFCADFPLPH